MTAMKKTDRMSYPSLRVLENAQTIALTNTYLMADHFEKSDGEKRIVPSSLDNHNIIRSESQAIDRFLS